MSAREYCSIPVVEALGLCLRFNKSFVVILAYDKIRGITDTTTYGVEADDKCRAAKVGELATTAMGVVPCAVFTDFRKEFDAGLYREALELLEKVYIDAFQPEMLPQVERLLGDAGMLSCPLPGKECPT